MRTQIINTIEIDEIRERGHLFSALHRVSQQIGMDRAFVHASPFVFTTLLVCLDKQTRTSYSGLDVLRMIHLLNRHYANTPEGAYDNALEHMREIETTTGDLATHLQFQNRGRTYSLNALFKLLKGICFFERGMHRLIQSYHLEDLDAFIRDYASSHNRGTYSGIRQCLQAWDGLFTRTSSKWQWSDILQDFRCGVIALQEGVAQIESTEAAFALHRIEHLLEIVNLALFSPISIQLMERRDRSKANLIVDLGGIESLPQSILRILPVDERQLDGALLGGILPIGGLVSFMKRYRSRKRSHYIAITHWEARFDATTRHVVRQLNRFVNLEEEC
jgi:hypothetical protein